MADIETDPQALASYAQNLDSLHSVIDKINDFMRTEGCDTAGFTGLFMVLRPVVDLVGLLYGETLKFGHNRLSSMTDGIKAAAQAYSDHENVAKKQFENLLRQLEMPTGVAPEHGGHAGSARPVY